MMHVKYGCTALVGALLKYKVNMMWGTRLADDTGTN